MSNNAKIFYSRFSHELFFTMYKFGDKGIFRWKTIFMMPN
jgi:hypothetical protein